MYIILSSPKFKIPQGRILISSAWVKRPLGSISFNSICTNPMVTEEDEAQKKQTVLPRTKAEKF